VDDPTPDSGPEREDLGGPADAAGSTDGGPAQVDLGEPVDQGPFLNDSGQPPTDGPAWPPADLGPGECVLAYEQLSPPDQPGSLFLVVRFDDRYLACADCEFELRSEEELSRSGVFSPCPDRAPDFVEVWGIVHEAHPPVHPAAGAEATPTQIGLRDLTCVAKYGLLLGASYEFSGFIPDAPEHRQASFHMDQTTARKVARRKTVSWVGASCPAPGGA